VHGPNRTRLNISCLDCKQEVTLPFAYTLYDATFNSVWIGNNGVVGFPYNDNDPENYCLSGWDMDYHILPFWDGLDMTVPSCPECDVYISTSGTAPNRIFNIEWIACEPDPSPGPNLGGPPKDDNPYIESCPWLDGYGLVNFELRLYEGLDQGQLRFDVIVDYAAYNAEGATIGVRDTSGRRDRRTEYVCNDVVPPLRDKLITFRASPQCPPPPQPTDTPTRTPTPTNTPTFTPTPCGGTFRDVCPGTEFYPYVECLVSQVPPVITGYNQPEQCPGGAAPCFKPGDPILRGSAFNVVAAAGEFSEPVSTGQQTFADVPYGHYAWLAAERLHMFPRNALDGYPCGQLPEEPCDFFSRPYARPAYWTYRGQIAKVISQAKGFQDTIPGTRQTFEDIPSSNPFWLYIERLYLHYVVNGYPCGQVAEEPCVPPANRPYYRPNSPLTRGQLAKMVALTFRINLESCSFAEPEGVQITVTAAPTMSPAATISPAPTFSAVASAVASPTVIVPTAQPTAPPPLTTIQVPTAIPTGPIPGTPWPPPPVSTGQPTVLPTGQPTP
jgi:hypothetical protein